MKNYFSIFDIPQSFALDETQLQRVYLQLQRQYHPDRQLGKDARERQHAIQAAMDINQAYATLKDPLRRAQHLLALEGIFVGDENDNVKADAATLAEVMELREELCESTSYPQFDALHKRVEKELEQQFVRLAAAFAGGDSGQAAQITIRLTYIQKLLRDIKVRRQAVLQQHQHKQNYESAANT